MQAVNEFRNIYLSAKAETKTEDILKARNCSIAIDNDLQSGNIVRYFRKDVKAKEGRRGPAKVIAVNGTSIFLNHGGQIINAHIKDIRKFRNELKHELGWQSENQKTEKAAMRNDKTKVKEDDTVENFVKHVSSEEPQNIMQEMLDAGMSKDKIQNGRHKCTSITSKDDRNVCLKDSVKLFVTDSSLTVLIDLNCFEFELLDCLPSVEMNQRRDIEKKSYDCSFNSPYLSRSELVLFDQKLVDLGCLSIVRSLRGRTRVPFEPLHSPPKHMRKVGQNDVAETIIDQQNDEDEVVEITVGATSSTQPQLSGDQPSGVSVENHSSKLINSSSEQHSEAPTDYSSDDSIKTEADDLVSGSLPDESCGAYSGNVEERSNDDPVPMMSAVRSGTTRSGRLVKQTALYGNPIATNVKSH